MILAITELKIFFALVQLMALLHGHSYSAHAMGCTAVLKAIQWFKDPCMNTNIEPEGKKLKEVHGIFLVATITAVTTLH